MLLICCWDVLSLKSVIIRWEENKKGVILVIRTAAWSHQSRATTVPAPSTAPGALGMYSPTLCHTKKQDRDVSNTFWGVALVCFMAFFIFTSDFHGFRQKMLFLLKHSPETLGSFCHLMQIHYFNVQF